MNRRSSCADKQHGNERITTMSTLHRPPLANTGKWWLVNCFIQVKPVNFFETLESQYCHDSLMIVYVTWRGRSDSISGLVDIAQVISD